MATTEPVVRDHALRRLHRHAVLYLRVRLELLELDLGAERQRLGGMLLAAALLALTALMTVQLAVLLLVAASWDTAWRLEVIGGLLLLALLAAAAAAGWLWRLRGEPARPISSALHDLDSFFSTPSNPEAERP